MRFEQTCPTLEGQQGIWWLDYFFNTCVYSYGEAVSSLFGTLAIGLWLVALLPQIYENWSRKSTDGLSTLFLALWLIGDAMNLVGCVILKQQPFQTFLSAYFTVTDLIMIIQYFMYRGNKPVQIGSVPTESTSLLSGNAVEERKQPWQRKSVWFMVGWVVGVAVFWIIVRHWHVIKPSIDMQVFGQTMAWASMIFYHSSRLPQLWLNHKRQSVEGLAMAMFVVIFSANGAYATSLITAIAMGDDDMFRRSLAFVYGSIGSMVLDVFVLMQFYMFNRRRKSAFEAVEA
ncbi:hypothetical protein FBU59_005413 [Linderina macrospora]|uniref:Uncharacterized protein n=1 Tax=Linderina macrospora TaxID=4868 RepID=A0ACC1J2N3_9FUNG|nr:hypothetical protein FBU59_005413 [Linderina macrospora]